MSSGLTIESSLGKNILLVERVLVDEISRLEDDNSEGTKFRLFRHR